MQTEVPFIALAFGAGGWLAAPVMAQEAVDLLRRSALAIRDAGTFAYRAERAPGGVLAGQLASVKGIVRLERVDSPDSLGARAWIKGELAIPGREGPVPFANTYDGRVYRSLRYADRTLVEGAPEDGGRSLFSDGGDGLLLLPLVDPAPFAREIECDALLHGESEVAGVRCVVVEIKMPPSSSYARARWHIGRDDHLPRRVEMLYAFAAEEGVQTTSVAELRPGAKLGDDDFALGVPEGFSRTSIEKASTLLPLGAPAPDWALHDPEGTVHRLSALRGQVVVMDFWATWCGPCRASMPAVQRVHEWFRGRGVEVFGIDYKDKGDAAGYMRKNGYTYTLLLDGDDVGAQYGVKGIPVFYVIGADGQVAYRHSGAGEKTEEELSEAVRAALLAADKP